MKEYQIKFEIFGKKMKTTVKANSEEEAKEIIREKIIFHSVKLKDFDFIKYFNNLKYEK